MAYWLVKSDPDAYSWENFKKDKETVWDGVRNYQARNNLRAMSLGDEVLFYHSQTEKSVIGLAIVSKESFQDPKTDDKRWLAVNLKVAYKFKNPVSLAQIKNNPTLQNIALIKQSRLSVMLLTSEEFITIVGMGN
ncbi:MAG TPA: EVE domain-containing protein [Candidatus Kapabacteria bacterium]|nr:EVE domain-containing protein [Candidatus Kapabacteria bacterium]